MPRRPRPASRPPPQNDSQAGAGLKYLKAPPTNQVEPDSESDSTSKPEAGPSKNYESESDIDAPRVSQWVDEEEIDAIRDVDDEESGEEEPAPDMQLKTLQDDLSSLPLGVLRKAQRTLAQAQVVHDSGGSDSEGPTYDTGKEEDAEENIANIKGKERLLPKPRTVKRANKHAPMEITSKKPVTRRRTVVEVKKTQSRDPRFLNATGELSADNFRKQYRFLADIHSNELQTLRDNLKRARKLLASSPRDLREEREREVDRLELAVKRVESTVNKDKREKVEQEALNRFAKEEKEKRKLGKGDWWMKDADKKELLVRARYDALASTGGKGAVKKAIEKKQKKIGQKEKKSRPFPRKRPFENPGDQSSTGGKRRKLV